MRMGPNRCLVTTSGLNGANLNKFSGQFAARSPKQRPENSISENYSFCCHGPQIPIHFFSRVRSGARKNGRTVASTEISIAADDCYRTAAFTPLAAMADVFEELSAAVKAKGSDYDLDLKKFCDACSLVSVLFGCLGIAFKFAELKYISKNRIQGSLSRNLRRVRQGLDLIRALFQNFLSSDDGCLKDAASLAYAKICAPYHTWAVRTAVYALPTRDQLLLKLNETEFSSEGND